MRGHGIALHGARQNFQIAKKLKMLLGWAAMRQDQLLVDWALAEKSKSYFQSIRCTKWSLKGDQQDEKCILLSIKRIR